MPPLLGTYTQMKCQNSTIIDDGGLSILLIDSVEETLWELKPGSHENCEVLYTANLDKRK